MCIILFAWQQHPDYPLIVAANRDEFHHRPAEAARWRGDLLCGIDLAAGGTWLGVTRAGRFAAVTNYREPIQEQTPGNRSRGMLPMGFLESDDTPLRWLEKLVPDQEQYGGFNMLACDGKELSYMGNRGGTPQTVKPGIYALSNGLLDTQWPKTERGKALMARALEGGADIQQLLDLLADQQLPDDEQLPETGVGIELERLVAPIFIRSAAYGTRASTALRFHQNGDFDFAEQRWQPSGFSAGEPTLILQQQ
ncbi:MAG: NRDE family protein [Gammaproteobacteria bacterium]|jgi:uncharacterized protein with NRDE domain|nr:NRDE family protein [Gammaproteobacteria bacterium]MBQ0774981.1 NRDE family protein [Gammaproteobacteria bacterium]|tara:strand:+ start:40831 stop:41586 length:756 start_codon:yes stop_codon:yes gene_type:complete